MEPGGASAARPSGEGADSCLERLKNSLPGPADLAGAASTLERILRESVCQLQGWLRVYVAAGEPYPIFGTAPLWG
ncbi:UNVERIFIED_CONTAM: hypothetical protein K2H54_026904 [Gekko kuhli]